MWKINKITQPFWIFGSWLVQARKVRVESLIITRINDLQGNVFSNVGTTEAWKYFLVKETLRHMQSNQSVTWEDLVVGPRHVVVDHPSLESHFLAHLPKLLGSWDFPHFQVLRAGGSLQDEESLTHKPQLWKTGQLGLAYCSLNLK